MNFQTYTSTSQLYGDTNPRYLNGTLPIFVNNFVPFDTQIFATSLFLASFVPLKLHVIFKTSLFFCLNLAYFLHVNIGIS